MYYIFSESQELVYNCPSSKFLIALTCLHTQDRPWNQKVILAIGRLGAHKQLWTSHGYQCLFFYIKCSLRMWYVFTFLTVSGFTEELCDISIRRGDVYQPSPTPSYDFDWCSYVPRIEMQYFENFRAKFRVRPTMSVILASWCVHFTIVAVFNGSCSVVWRRYSDNRPTLHSPSKIESGFSKVWIRTPFGYNHWSYTLSLDDIIDACILYTFEIGSLTRWALSCVPENDRLSNVDSVTTVVSLICVRTLSSASELF